jgi:hypothetical protein
VIAGDCTGYGMRDGNLLYIADVPSGLACRCVCARCGKLLVAKKGLVRRHHFAHFKITNCQGAAESALHLLAKELLAEMDSFTVPPYAFVRQRKTRAGVPVRHQAQVAKGGQFPILKVRIEEHEGDFVPDIVIEAGAKSLIVEVAVTHKVTRAKLRKIRRRDLPAIEIRLDAIDSMLPRELLKVKLQQDLASKVWLFHPAQRVAERMFASTYRTVLARGRVKVTMGSAPVVYRRDLTPVPPQSGSSSQPDWRECDRVGEEFNRTNGRYPNAEECQKLWPHLFKASKS